MFGEIPGGRGEQRTGILGCILGKLSKGRDLTSHHSAFLRPEGKVRMTQEEKYSRCVQAQETAYREELEAKIGA